MKKVLKRVVVLLLTGALLCGLCGCAALDEMRERQAFREENGDILLNGVVYKSLPQNDYFKPKVEYSNLINLTDNDVPVLLSLFLAKERMAANEDRTILVGGDGYYCIAEKYEEMSQRLTEMFEPEIICYFYEEFDEEKNSWEEKYYTLTQEQADAIALVVTTVEPTSYSQTGMRPEYHYSLDIVECSEDMLLQACNLSLLVGYDRYYLELYTDTDILIFPVPEGCKAVFDDIVSVYEETGGYTQQNDFEM